MRNLLFFVPYILIYIVALFSTELVYCNDLAHNDSLHTNFSMNTDFDFLKKWDLDGDTKNDSISFNYSGGAHCCYTLTIVLSSDGIRHSFPFEMDGGYFSGPNGSRPEHFNIKDYDNDSLPEIFMEIETYGNDAYPIPKEYTEKYGITSNYIIIEYSDSLHISSFPKSISVEQYFYSRNRDAQNKKLTPFKRHHYGYKDENGETVILNQLLEAGEFADGIAVVTTKKYGKVVINQKGEILRDLEGFYLLDETRDKQGLLTLFNGGDRFFFLDNKGTIIQLPYSDVKSFSQGLAAVEDSASGKWGYVNRDTTFVIPPQFDFASSFENDTALVEKDKKFFKITLKGKIVSE